MLDKAVLVLPPVAHETWDAKYRWKNSDHSYNDQTIEDTWRRVAKHLASVEVTGSQVLWEDTFFDAMVSYRFLPAGRILAGAGTGWRTTLFNCFVMGTIDDSMEGILEAHKEAMLSLRMGGGVGMDFSTLRPKGAAVAGVGADASGPLSFMDIWDTACRTLMAAGARRGAMMATLICTHPDIEDFVDAKWDKTRFRNFNLSVLVTDNFMNAVRLDNPWELFFNGKVYKTILARDLWNKIMHNTYDMAEPGVIFIDRVNEQNNLWYCETISCTNPCITGDTLIAVAGRGPVSIAQLTEEGKDVPVYATDTSTGETVVRWGRNPRVTKRNAELVKVTLDDGSSIRCTPDHKVPLRDGRKVEAKDLKAGDSLFRFDQIVPANGDVYVKQNGGARTSESHLIAEAKYGRKFRWGTKRGEYHVHHIDEDHYNNSWDNVEVKLSEKHSSDHTSERFSDPVYRLKHGEAVKASMTPEVRKRLSSKAKARYQTFDKACLNCGESFQVRAKSETTGKGPQQFCSQRCAVVYKNRAGAGVPLSEERRAAISAQQKGRKHSDEHNAKVSAALKGKAKSDAHCLAISEAARKRTDQTRDERGQYTNHKIVSVEPCGREDVYNITVDEFHNYAIVTSETHNDRYNHTAYSGVIYSNCGEQPLPPMGACLLGSVNLTTHVIDPFGESPCLDISTLQETVRTAVRMMDNVVDVSNYPLEQQKCEAKNKRRIGLGVTGLADALTMCRYRYGSEMAAEVTEMWMQEIKEAAYWASVELAKEKGPFPLFDSVKYLKGAFIQTLPFNLQNAIAEYGIRNSHVTSVAPTGTISLFAGNLSSGVEPAFSYEHSRKVLMATGERKTLNLKNYAYGMYREKIDTDMGHELPEYFVTAMNLSPAEHLRMLSAVQKHVDSAVSKTVNIPADMPFEDFCNVYQEAYDIGLKCCATYRPNDITGSVLEDTTKKPDQLVGFAIQADVQNIPTTSIDLLNNPPARERVLPGFTYKLKWPDSDHAMYVTINDVMDNGKQRPHEIFINSKNMEHYAWTVALTRMISAVFRRGGDVRFVVEELKAIFDPRGGAWVPSETGTKYVPSVLAMIGGTIEKHMIDIGFMSMPVVAAETLDDVPVGTMLRQCPKCAEASIIRQEGCDKCIACDYSRCG